MQKILITGANGLLGCEFRERLQGKKNIFATRTDCDITDIDNIRQYVQGKDIGIIINCAANCNAEEMENDEVVARKITVVGPRNLAIISKEIGATLVHFSSDYVFDGKKSFPYQETDETAGLSVYGKLKAESEKEILQEADTVLIFRTAWLFSVYGKDFVKTIKKLAESRTELKVIYDQVGSPCYAGDLAQYVLEILPQVKKGTKEIYHLTNEGVCSWYDLACQIVKGFQLNCQVIPIPSEEFVQKAPRPHYSVLDKKKVKKDFGINLRHYSESLADCIAKLKGG